MKALSREEFATALKKGQGRAWWHIAEHGLDDVADLVLEACLHDQRYDSSECSRADWLFEMFGATVHYRRFHAAILAALQPEANAWEADQLCELAKAMAAQGDVQARQALRSYAFDKASHRTNDDGLGAEEWIALTGFDGLIELAHIYGQRLLIDSADTPGNLWWSDEEMPIFHTALLQHAPTDIAVAAYCKYLEAHGAFTPRRPLDREAARQQARQHIRAQSTLDQILDEAKIGIVPQFP